MSAASPRPKNHPRLRKAFRFVAATLTRTFALDDFSAYVRDGAIMPMQVSSAYTGFEASVDPNTGCRRRKLPNTLT